MREVLHIAVCVVATTKGHERSHVYPSLVKRTSKPPGELGYFVNAAQPGCAFSHTCRPRMLDTCLQDVASSIQKLRFETS